MQAAGFSGTQNSLFEFDRKTLLSAHWAGVDEAGRGPLAGPVVAAAVILILPEGLEGLNDSKKLSEKKREILYDLIIENSSYKIVRFSAEYLDMHGLSSCLKKGLES